MTITVSYTQTALAAKNKIEGTEGGDTIEGTTGNDKIDSKGGNDGGQTFGPMLMLSMNGTISTTDTEET